MDVPEPSGAFLGIGVLFVPLGAIITVQVLIFRVGGLSALVDSAGASNAFVVIPALALGVLLTLLGLAIVQAVVALAMVELDERRRVSARRVYRLVAGRLPPLVESLLGAAIVVAILPVTVVGLPVASSSPSAGRSSHAAVCRRRHRLPLLRPRRARQARARARGDRALIPADI